MNRRALVLTVVLVLAQTAALVWWAARRGRPILYTHCGTCHRPGGRSFTLHAYDSVAPRAAAIAASTS